MSTGDKIGICNLTTGKLPRLPFEHFKKAALEKNYILSLVFTDIKLAKKLNKTYRGKNKPANVLSFALTRESGEIFINLSIAKTPVRIARLFIHALCHLKGMRHGSKMESEERKILQSFSF